MSAGQRVLAQHALAGVSGTGVEVSSRTTEREFLQEGVFHVIPQEWVTIALDEPDSRGRMRVVLPRGAVTEVER